MERKGSSVLGHMLVTLLLLSVFFYSTESALPSHHIKLSITGRRLSMAYHKQEGDIGTPSSRSGRGGGHGRRLMSIYRAPNGDIDTSPSRSGHGGGHIHDQHSSP